MVFAIPATGTLVIPHFARATTRFLVTLERALNELQKRTYLDIDHGKDDDSVLLLLCPCLANVMQIREPVRRIRSAGCLKSLKVQEKKADERERSLDNN